MRFGLDVPAGTEPVLDAEHDRYEWVDQAEALRRCQPAAVADGVAIAAAALAAPVSFRPLTEPDLPALVAWHAAPHVARWFREPLDLDAARRKYGPRIAGQSATRVHVIMVAGQDAGFAQHYRVGDYPAYATATGLPAAAGLDYAIGRPELTGHGLGPQVIWAYVRDVVRSAHPAATQALASPEIGNLRSVRALAKAGFVRSAEISVDGEPAPEQLCVLDLTRFFGERGR